MQGKLMMLKKIDDAVNKFEGTVSVVLFLIMVLVVCWSVICRRVLKITFLQGEELARYLMIYVVYLGTSVGVKNKSHIGVEVFVDLLPEKARKYVKIATETLCMLIFLLLFVLAIQYMMHLVKTMQMTTTTQIPMFCIFVCVPVSMFLGILHYIVEISDMIRNVLPQKGEEV